MKLEKTSENISWRDYFWIVLFFGLALALRLPRLGSLDVWFDEVALLFQVKMPFLQIWTFCKDENFPPLYGWILKVWGFLSSEAYWFRLLSAFFGAAIPAAAYLLGREISDRRLGILLAGACLISLPLIFYSQIIRMYSLWVFMACLSYLSLYRAVRTNEWKYWILLAVSNLIGYYTFLPSIFFIIAEILIIIGHYRFEYTRYKRFLWSHTPALLLMALWASTLLLRYQKVHEYVTWKLDFWALYNVWVYFGTNTAWVNKFIIDTILNLPLLVGLILGIPFWFKKKDVLIAGALFLLGGGGIALVSLVGHTMFFGRYLLFLLPLYLGLSLYGWLMVTSKWWRWLGLGCVFLVLGATFLYHNIEYVQSNDWLRYAGQSQSLPGDDGHSFSRTAALLHQRLQTGEVILHYTSGDIRKRCLGYFPLVYYHQQALPEYLYSEDPVPMYCGGQYLLQNQQVKALQDLHPEPRGIWVVSFDKPDYLDYMSFESQRVRAKNTLGAKEDLYKVLYLAGYRLTDLNVDHSMTAAHFKKYTLPDGPDNPRIIEN